MIQTAVSGAENYVEAGETENEVMQDTADYIDSVVASIKGEDTSGGSSGTGTDLSTLSETKRLELVGQYVDYSPNTADGTTYSLTTNSSVYAGTTNNTADFYEDTSLNWRIWSITDDTLTLIADNAAQTGGYSTGYLYLSGATGYNNAVYLINGICETLYSNSEIGATARSLDIVDIEEVMDWSVWKPTDYLYSSYYTYISTKQYTGSYAYYPNLWAYEDFANINGTTVNEAYYTYDTETNTHTYTSTNSKLRRNEQTTPIASTEGTYTQASSIEPTETYWNKSMSTSNFIDSKYYNLIYENGSSSDISYWLASRSIYLRSSEARFGLQSVDVYYLSISDMYMSYNGSNESFNRIRPVVSIPLTSLTLDLTSNTGDTSDDAYKIVEK